jgi:hypothetical protein
MIRTILISTALLALAGAAQADTIKVSLAGKTETAAKVEIAKATETVCRYAPVMEYNACVQETYQDAMAQLARIKALRTASLTF